MILPLKPGKKYNVKTILVEPFSIDYRFENMGKKYIPNLLIIYEYGTKVIVEIKFSSEISEQKNQQKFDATLRYAENNNMHFIIRGMNIQESGYKKTGVFGWVEKYSFCVFLFAAISLNIYNLILGSPIIGCDSKEWGIFILLAISPEN
ncbi:Tn7 transposase TnsA N-terminal domain-containing protein [Psychrobacillus sp. NPDC058041]|uniref:Tn7 transposase TnsA N-terminal domain-containing protein n=1 Tax=Psychrobacillus sp. NPDC058041 TaxID=3346310 RepID=UPI0036DF232B